jgi:apyrase
MIYYIYFYFSENKALSDDIINNIARKLGPNGDARILSGEEEGLYGWISSNYINGNFRFKIPNKRQIRETVGALDMGGASTQISFTPEDPNSIENNYKLAVDIFGDTYNTYSRTYLCYGANEAVRRILAYSLMEAGYNSVISNPCFHTGDSLNYTYDYFNGKPCTEDLIPSGSLDSNQTYMFIGASNFTTCQDLVAKAMNFSVELPGGNTIDYNPPPNAKGNFFGFSSYYYNANFFNFENLNASNFNNFKETVSRHCFSSWSDVRYY